MPATAERAAFVREEFRSVSYKNEGVRDAYGKVARDTKDDPVTSYFDDIADAWMLVQERGQILAAHARRFRVQIDSVIGEDQIPMGLGLPTAQLIDDNLVADMPVAIVGYESLDLEAERTTLQVWGTIGLIADPIDDEYPGVVSAVGVASGSSTAIAEATQPLSPAVGAAAGAGAAAAVGVTVKPAVGTASGASTASAEGVTLGTYSAVGVAAGSSAAAAVGVTVVQAVAVASGSSAAAASSPPDSVTADTTAFTADTTALTADKS